MTDFTRLHKGRDADHLERCFCGKPSKVHVRWTWGCGNVCGIHASKMKQKTPGLRTDDVVFICREHELEFQDPGELDFHRWKEHNPDEEVRK